MAGQHPGQGFDVGGPHFGSHIPAVAAHELHEVAVLEQHVLLQDLDVGLGLAQVVDPAQGRVLSGGSGAGSLSCLCWAKYLNIQRAQHMSGHLRHHSQGSSAAAGQQRRILVPHHPVQACCQGQHGRHCPFTACTAVGSTLMTTPDCHCFASQAL